jgi:probable F420-dependent oxidoreductase
MHVPLGQITGGFQTMEGVAAMSTALEDAGIDAANLTDHPAPDSAWLHAHGHDAVDPFTALGFMAASSTSLLLHTNIVVLPYRNIFITAKSAATLQMLSGGRLILGVGVGYQQIEFEALGVDFARRGALMNEALQTLELTWAGGAVSAQGSGFSAVGVEPRPVPDPRPAIWIGGGSDRAVERAIRYGNGWSPFLVSPTVSRINQAAAIQSFDQLANKIRHIHGRRAELGKASSFTIALDLGGQRHPVDRSRAEIGRFAKLIGELAAIGVEWTVLKPSAPDLTSFVNTVRWYGDEVIPAAKAMAAG